MKAVLLALALALVAMIVIGRHGDESADGASGPRLFGGSGCTVEADAPARDSRNNRIVATARHRCGRSGAELDFTVYLQMRAPNGGWTTIDERPVAGPASRKQRTVTAVGGCVEGVYRTFLRGTVTIDGRTRSFEDDSRPVTNPCRGARAV